MSTDNNIEYYIPKFKMEQLMKDGYNYSLKKINNLEEEFNEILFNRSCTGMTRARADKLPSVMSIGIKAILIDKEYKSNIWLVDESFSGDRKKKISIPGGHLTTPYEDDTVESFLRENLIRELYEEFSSSKCICNQYHTDDIGYHLTKLGFQEADEINDGWYYQYTPYYLSFFKVMNVLPDTFITNRNAVPFSLEDYNQLRLIREYHENSFTRIARERLNIPQDIKSDIRLSRKSRYCKMLGAVMELVQNLKNI